MLVIQSAQLTWLQLQKYLLIRAVEGSATNCARLYIGPIDGLSHWVEVDGDRVLRLTGSWQLEHRGAVQRHLEQLTLRTVDEQQKVVVHDCSRVDTADNIAYISRVKLDKRRHNQSISQSINQKFLEWPK